MKSVCQASYAKSADFNEDAYQGYQTVEAHEFRRSAPCWNRTNNLLIKSQAASTVNPEEAANSEVCAARGAAVEHETVPIDPALVPLIDRWPTLPEALKAGILAMVRSATE